MYRVFDCGVSEYALGVWHMYSVYSIYCMLSEVKNKSVVKNQPIEKLVVLKVIEFVEKVGVKIQESRGCPFEMISW